MPEVTPDAAAPAEYRRALHVIFFIVMLDLFGFGIIIPLLPFYVPGYQTNSLTQTFQVTLLFALYSICQFIGAPLLGLMSDRFGRRPVLILSQVGSAAGYLLLGFATQPQFGFNPATILLLVYVSRVVDGFTGGNISTAQAYISDITTPQTRARAMGMLGAAFGIGFVLGPAAGGLLGKVHHSLPAYVAMVMSAAAAYFSWASLPESRPKGPTEAEAWLHPGRFGPILRQPILLQLLLISFFSMAAFVMMESTSALYFIHRYGWAEWQIGLYFTYLGVIIIFVQGGYLRRHKGKSEWPLATLGPLLVAGGMVFYVTTGYVAGIAVLMLAGLFNATGRSLQGPMLSSLVSKHSGRDEQGAVFGLYHGLGSLARVAGPLAAAPAFGYLNHTGQFLMAAVLAGGCGLWTVALARQAGGAVEGQAQASPEAALIEP